MGKVYQYGNAKNINDMIIYAVKDRLRVVVVDLVVESGCCHLDGLRDRKPKLG